MTYLPLPSAMSWSPSAMLLVKSEGSHCISCSEEKPRMAQLVRIPTNTIQRITSNHTPMSRALHEQEDTKINEKFADLKFIHENSCFYHQSQNCTCKSIRGNHPIACSSSVKSRCLALRTGCGRCMYHGTWIRR